MDNDSKDFNANIESGYPGFNQQPFDVSLPIPAGASANFDISMTGHYNAGERGLVVCGDFSANPVIGDIHNSGNSDKENISGENNEISVFIDGSGINFDVPPNIEDNRTLVPIS